MAVVYTCKIPPLGKMLFFFVVKCGIVFVVDMLIFFYSIHSLCTFTRDTDLANNPPEDGNMYCQDLIPDSYGVLDSPSTCYDRTLCYPPQETKCKKYGETRNNNGDLITDELEQHLRFRISGIGTKLNIEDNTAVQQGGGFWFSGQSSLTLALGAHLSKFKAVETATPFPVWQ